MTWLTLIPTVAVILAAAAICWAESRELVDDLTRDVRDKS